MSGPFPETAPPAPAQVLRDLLAGVGLPAELADDVDLTGSEPVLPSSFAVGTVAQVSIAAVAAAAADLWLLRGGRRQDIAVNMRHAALEYRSERYFTTDGNPPGRVWDAIAGTYRCSDGRWVRIHTNFPHHRDGVLELLGCDNARESVQAALERWEAAAFEDAAATRGLVATMMRSPEEWLATPQGAALENQPLISLERIGDAPPQPLGQVERPLGDLKVLDLTRIVAGPVGCKALAAHGAEVMRIASPKLPFISAAVKDYGRGKLSAYADLETEDGRADLTALAKEADVFVQAYRPGAIAARGFSPEALAALRPGIVYVSLCAYGHAGPWAARRGFDSLVQTASGINHAEAEAAGSEGPKELPCQALDHASGYLMALGAIAGLKRRAEEGGSWHVRVSLARSGRWLQSLGRVAGGLDCRDPAPSDDLFEESESGFGRLRAIRHAAQLSETPARWKRPSMPLGSHPPRWPK
ncbi:CoA transferase [Pelagibius marinus]|uniref:CoA transferase n=1 Tax=Pelagibius marinus TaxID=2762760 RepID=UPI0018733CE4|nr:CoA transferase [Pelagibius marinus]